MTCLSREGTRETSHSGNDTLRFVGAWFYRLELSAGTVYFLPGL